MPETFEHMLRKENVEGYEIPECGHAPSLMPNEQTQIITQWLERQPPHESS